MDTITLTILTAFITAVLGPVIVEWIKSKFINKTTDILGESIYNDEKIDHQLELIMEELDCDRICIAQFHNGGHFYPTGKSIKKFSIFYEQTTDNGTSVLFNKIFTLTNGSIDRVEYGPKGASVMVAQKWADGIKMTSMSKQKGLLI